MNSALVVKYAEIHLKGLNRPYFERKLVEKIEEVLSDAHPRVVREQGRIFVYDLPEENMDEYAKRLQKVFGIHSVCIAACCEKDFGEITKAAIALMAPYAKDGATFKVFARRADKRFPLTSEQLCRELGHELLTAYENLKVDVHCPKVPVTVEIRQDLAFVYTGELPCAGGMPVGTNGKAMLLISGGIDSPVAGYMIAKRGVSLAAVHFYSYPYTSERARDKVVELAKIVSQYAGSFDLYLVPFTEIQTTIYDKCPSSETTVLMRRLMMKIAERIAKDCGAQALITGESLGQVASQTIESLAVTNDAVDMPVFRPLIGFDKEEIIDRAQRIGTFETSILPYEDCCTVFVPQHPVTRPSVQKLRESEALVDFEPLMDTAIRNTEVMTISHNLFD
ncbi:MAG: tRNA 4-thiouridine(8) synthase ThiI [Clostridia bacterium]|nr:tRNA 4-thiouridine(8) synthase ThiI [Clostridia bacterium]